MLLYYITDRKQFRGPEARRRELLLAKISEAACAGVDYIQLREKDLAARELESLARDAVRVCRETRDQQRETKLLINSRADIAIVTGAAGIHLPSNDIPASYARTIWSVALTRNSQLETRTCIVAASCHSADEVRLVQTEGANFAVFGPVFEKVGTSLSVGLDALCAVCHVGQMPVLAIGGITLENAGACLQAGAAGIAAIRLFQENAAREIVGKLRQLG